jgi:two-component SAPR family response regulator
MWPNSHFRDKNGGGGNHRPAEFVFVMMKKTAADLGSRRVLVVEDELLLALEIERVLEEAGAAVIGPVATLHQALERIKAEQIDLALLDINLGGQQVFPAAEALVERKIPAVLTTGYSTHVVPDHLRHLQMINKPFDAAALCQTVARALRSNGAGSSSTHH